MPALLIVRIPLSAATSSDQPSLKLDIFCTVDIVILRVADAPDATLHLTDVSDSQSVLSHPVFPVRPFAV